MKIVFCPRGTVPFHGRSLNDSFLTETERGVIHLAEALQELGHEVTVLTDIQNPPETAPRYLYYRLAEKIGAVDFVIAVKDWRGIFLPFKTKRTFFWTGDLSTDLSSLGLGDQRVISKLTKTFFVSDWQKQTLCYTSGFPLQRGEILPFGNVQKNFQKKVERKKRKLIFAGNAENGLAYLSLAYLKLKQKYPDLELSIFNFFSTDQGIAAAQKILLQLFKGIPGCQIHLNFTEEALIEGLLESSICIYPASREEAIPTPVIMAQAAGCAIVTSTVGSLPEFVGVAGKFIQGVPGSDPFLQGMIAVLEQLLEDEKLLQHYSQEALKRAEKWDNKTLARHFEAYL